MHNEMAMKLSRYGSEGDAAVETQCFGSDPEAAFPLTKDLAARLIGGPYRSQDMRFEYLLSDILYR